MADTLGTATTAAEFIPEVWSRDIQIARESNLFMAGLVQRFDRDIMSHGDIIHIPNLANLSAGDISTSTGAIDSVANTDTSTTLTINKWKGTVVKLLDIARIQAYPDLLKLYTDRIAYSLALIVETDLTALAPALSQTVGTFNTALVDGNFRTAVQTLDDARVPFTDRHLAIKPAVKNTLLGIDKFVRYDAVPYPKGESPILRGNVGEIYGVAVHVSPEVFKTSNDTSNMMFHRDTFALAMQKSPKMVHFAKPAGVFLEAIGGSELYGLVEVRDDHGVELRS